MNEQWTMDNMYSLFQIVPICDAVVVNRVFTIYTWIRIFQLTHFLREQGQCVY